MNAKEIADSINNNWDHSGFEIYYEYHDLDCCPTNFIRVLQGEGRLSLGTITLSPTNVNGRWKLSENPWDKSIQIYYIRRYTGERE